MRFVNVSFFTLIVALFFYGPARSATQACTEIKQLNQLTDAEKENFPPSFLNLPLFLIINVHFGYGAAIQVLKVTDATTGEERLKAISNVRSPDLDYQTDCYIKKVCKIGQKFELFLENGRHIKTEENKGQIIVEDHSFKKGKAEDFLKVSNAIDEKRGSKTKTIVAPTGSSALGVK